MPHSILETNEKYCWWHDIMESINYLSSAQKEYSFIQGFQPNWINRVPINFEPKKEITKRRRRNSTIDVESSFVDLLSLIENGSLQYILGRIKLISKFEFPKRRSSNYFGVSRNGENWQALINCGKIKKYVGTFSSEREAAISYDFYAIWLHLSKAKTNFTYDSQLIIEMIQSYNRISKSFDPSRFIGRI